MVPRLECTIRDLSIASLRVPIYLFLRFIHPHRLLSSSLVLRVVSIVSLTLNNSLCGRLMIGGGALRLQMKSYCPIKDGRRYLIHGTGSLQLLLSILPCLIAISFTVFFLLIRP